MPNGSEELIERIASANVTTGYIRNDDGGDKYSSYLEANVHVDEVFAVFKQLALSLMPDIAAPIIGLKDEEPTFGPYTSREAALEVLEQHSELLANDGFLEFGITYQHSGRVEEIFVKSSKYLQIWTNQPDSAANVFYEAGIPAVATLEFIDEYPMVSKSINRRGDAASPAVLEAVKSAFETLPVAVPDQ
ncbi:MAG: hypothetical protein H0U23_09490 [Blastocatellia bacterium]|nr:hypothetical protein [Blastocatellia bacterium]